MSTSLSKPPSSVIAISRSPRRTAGIDSCGSSSEISTSMAGRSGRKAATARGTIVPAAVANEPIRRRPRAWAATSCSSSSAAASCAITRSVWRTSTSPAGVRRTPRGSRSISFTPTCFSSRAICCEIAGWV